MNLPDFYLYRIPVFSIGKGIVVFRLYSHHSVGREAYDPVLVVIFDVAEGGLPQTYCNKSSLCVILAFNVFFSSAVFIIRIQHEDPEVSILFLLVFDVVDKKQTLLVEYRILSKEDEFSLYILHLYAFYISGNLIEGSVSNRISLFCLFVLGACCRHYNGQCSNNYSLHDSKCLFVQNKYTQTLTKRVKKKNAHRVVCV